MSKNHDDIICEGGPAFPCSNEQFCSGHASPGMTLRDYFAGQALAGLVAAFAISTNDPAEAEAERRRKARACYALADAMLAAREVAP